MRSGSSHRENKIPDGLYIIVNLKALTTHRLETESNKSLPIATYFPMTKLNLNDFVKLLVYRSVLPELVYCLYSCLSTISVST